MMRRGLAGTAMLSLMLVSVVTGEEKEQWQRMLRGEDAKKAAALQKQIDALGADGRFAESIKPAEELLALRQRVQGDKHWQTIDVRVQRDTMKLLAAQPSAAQKDIIAAHKQMAEANRLYAQGRYTDADPLYRQALALRRNVLGDQHPDFATSLNNLAVDLDAQGKYADADTLHRQALDIRRKALGEQHPDLAVSLSNLARLLNARGKYAQAETLHHQALAIRRAALGERHPDTASNLNNLAYTLNAQTKYAEAEPLYRQALAATREVFPEQHSDVANSLNNLAANLDAQGKHGDAEPLFRRAVDIWSKVLPAQHPNIPVGINNLASNLQAQGKFADAESLSRLVLDICRKTLDDRHPRIALSLNNLATNWDAQGKYAEAELLYRRALDICRKALPEQHPFIASSLNNLAYNLNAQGKYAEAEPLCRQALALRLKTLPQQHPDIAISCNNLAFNLNAQRRPAEAEALHRQALALFRAARGEQHPDTLLSLNNLAGDLTEQGKHVEAEPLYRRAVAHFRKVVGEEHPRTGLSLNNLASALLAQGKHAQAEPLLRAAAASFEMARLRISSSGFERASFGVEHAPLAPLAACLARLGKPADAWHYAEGGLGRGLLDDLTAQTQLFLSAEEQKSFRTRLAHLEQLNRLLLPLLTAEKLKDAERARREELVKERDSLQAEAARQAAERSRREVWSLERIQKQLPADAALVLWIDVKAKAKAADPNGEHWGCVLRQRGEPAWVRLPGSGENDAWTPSDDQLSRRLRDDLASGETGWQQHARQLSRQRLTPLLPYLNARAGLPVVRHLIAVPAGWMASIPLETLTNDYTISYAPSGTVFARLQEQHRKLHQPTLLAVGDPNFNLPKDKPPPLPEHGLLLTLVLSGGNASKAGLRDGDVLLDYNGHPLHALADLKPASSGESVPVQVWRDGKTFKARLSAGKLDVSIDRQPAAEALCRQRDFDALLASRSRDQIAALPASRYEVKALEPLFPKATVLLGSDASEQKLDDLASADRLKDYRVLHLATHGKVNLSSALQSSLLLARDHLPDVNEQARKGGKIYDGRLRAATMAANWRLDADLVTLSACQTALGPSGGGDGLLGFSQVLFRKGARSLLLSLWKVDDTATALLMTRFYENWLGRGKDLKASLSKSESLREAKQWLRNLRRAERDRLASRLVSGELRGTLVAAKPVTETSKGAADMPYAHPRYWAAFILIGDPN